MSGINDDLETANEGNDNRRECHTRTKKVNIELDLDTTIYDSSKSKYLSWIDLAKAIDAWRIFPRIFLTVYIVLLYKVVIWFMAIPVPSAEQSALVSIVVGAGAAWFGLYTGTGIKIGNSNREHRD